MYKRQAFDKIGLYSVAIAASFFTAMALAIVRDYRDNDEKAAAKARRRQASAHEAEPTAAAPAAATESITETATVEGAEAPTAAEVAAEAVTVTSPLEGRAVPISEIPDPVFSTGVVGDGIAIEPTSNTVVCPADATVVTAPDSGHAFGLKLDSGVELLIHVGIDTVELGGKGFDVKVKAGDHVSAGQPLVVFDPTVIDEAGYSKITPVLVTNGFDYSNVTGIPADDVTTGTPVITVVK